MIALLALALPVFGLCADEPETEIMARSPSFFFEKQVFNRGKADGYKAVIHIVSAKDPAIREPLPGAKSGVRISTFDISLAAR